MISGTTEVIVMNVLVVYDSKYGNTLEVARQIGEAMKQGANVDLRSTSETGSVPQDLDLLIVGSPTQAHGVEQTMKDFLDNLPADSVRNVPVAVFDTRLKWPKLLSGSAADGVAKRLERKGARLVDDPASFLVEGAEGPLVEGEAHRAAEWGRHLLTEMNATA
jgi:flavodoxin